MCRLFEPFVTSKERGTGMGLAISKRIMQEHGGRLTGSNAPPGGAVFVVEVPLADEVTANSGRSDCDRPIIVNASENSCAQASPAISH
jgi:nitrogen-specific signal transduction histidine kinase